MKEKIKLIAFIILFVIVASYPFAMRHLTARTEKSVEDFTKYMDSINHESEKTFEKYKKSLQQRYKTSDSILAIRNSLSKDMDKLISRQNQLIKEREQILIRKEIETNNLWRSDAPLH